MRQRTNAARVPYQLNRHDVRSPEGPAAAAAGFELLERRVLLAATHVVTELLSSAVADSAVVQPLKAATPLASGRKGTPVTAARTHVRSHAAAPDPRAMAAALTEGPAGGPAAVTAHTVAMPPLTPYGVPGTMVYRSVSPLITLASPGDTVDVTFDIPTLFPHIDLTGTPGQVFSFTITPAPGSELVPQVAIYNPSGTLHGLAGTGTGALVVQKSPATEVAVQTLRITGTNGTAGAFTVLLNVGAALEREVAFEPASFRNDTRFNPRFTGEFVTTDATSGASIASVLATGSAATETSTVDDDWYSVVLPLHALATIKAVSLGSSGPAPAVAVYDFNGALLASGAKGSVPDFTYNQPMVYVKVTAQIGTEYQLIITHDASLDVFVLPGDADGDRTVGPGDFNILASHFGLGEQNWSTGDFDGDGLVGPSDFNLLASRFGTTLQGPSIP
jgi:hypothetical protein